MGKKARRHLHRQQQQINHQNLEQKINFPEKIQDIAQKQKPTKDDKGKDEKEKENENKIEIKTVNNVPIEDVKDCDIIKIAAKNIVEINGPEKLDDHETNNNFDFDFLNDTKKDSEEVFDDDNDTKKGNDSIEEQYESHPSIPFEDPIEILTDDNSRHSHKDESSKLDKTDVKNVFGEDLGLENGSNYDNLFNGN